MTELDLAYQMFIDELPKGASGVIPKYKFAEMIRKDYPVLEEYLKRARHKIREEKLKRISDDLERNT